MKAWKKTAVTIGCTLGIGMGLGAGIALAARQPHMEAALARLQEARHQLDVAAHNKAGHRAKAIALIDEAIGEVKAGIVAGNAAP